MVLLAAILFLRVTMATNALQIAPRRGFVGLLMGNLWFFQIAIPSSLQLQFEPTIFVFSQQRVSRQDTLPISVLSISLEAVFLLSSSLSSSLSVSDSEEESVSSSYSSFVGTGFSFCCRFKNLL